MLLGIISCVVDNSPVTCSSKKGPDHSHERQRQRSYYMRHGRKICRDMFMFLYRFVSVQRLTFSYKYSWQKWTIVTNNSVWCIAFQRTNSTHWRSGIGKMEWPWGRNHRVEGRTIVEVYQLKMYAKLWALWPDMPRWMRSVYRAEYQLMLEMTLWFSRPVPQKRRFIISMNERQEKPVSPTMDLLEGLHAII